MRHAWRTLSMVGFASFLSSNSVSALNVAIPTVVRHFDASSAAGNWILLISVMTTTMLMITFGRLADMFGRRTMYLTGLAGFRSSANVFGTSIPSL
ncbi:MFS transporter [Nocardia jiangxiensis]|uniref:MFS transporter n=1 Tax=Nocardia jiangxiensis TaxID=282685 RepID=A0ABW6SHN8_9NOCA